MTKVISFVTKGHLPDVVRYVKRVKTYFGLFHKVEYTVDYKQSRLFDSEEEMATVEKLIKSKYGEAVVIDRLDDRDLRIRGIEPFYVIVNEDGDSERYFMDFGQKKPSFTSDVRKSYISQSLKDVKEVLTKIRVMGGKKLTYVPVAMNIENALQEPNFVIICKNKLSGRLLYLQEMYVNSEVKLNPNLKSAKRLGYDDAVEWYEELAAKNKQNHYAVINCPKEEVKSRNLPAYFKSHPNEPKVAVSFRLPDYKKSKNGD